MAAAGLSASCAIAGRYAVEPVCEGCEPVGCFGVVDAEHPLFFGGHVDARGVRHDPLMHASDCERWMPLLWEGDDA